MTAQDLADALDWVGIDYSVRQTECKEQTRITINTTDISRLVDLLISGAKHDR